MKAKSYKTLTSIYIIFFEHLLNTILDKVTTYSRKTYRKSENTVTIILKISTNNV